MALKTWTTNYPAALDTTSNQPAVVNTVDDTDASQINSIAAAVRALETKVGATSPAAGSQGASIATNTADIATNTADIATNTSNIAAIFSDSKFQLVRAGSATLSIQVWPGTALATGYCTLQDGVQRSLPATVTVDITDSGELGLDTGSESSNTWYFAYLVPSTADDSVLTGILSTTSPRSGGPGGYSNYKPVGSWRNNNSGDLLSGHYVFPGQFLFNYSQGGDISGSTSWDANPVTLDLSSYVPDTASSVSLHLRLQGNGTTQGSFAVWPSEGGAISSASLVVWLSGDYSDNEVNNGWCLIAGGAQSVIYQKVQGNGNILYSFMNILGYIDEYCC